MSPFDAATLSQCGGPDHCVSRQVQEVFKIKPEDGERSVGCLVMGGTEMDKVFLACGQTIKASATPVAPKELPPDPSRGACTKLRLWHGPHCSLGGLHAGCMPLTLCFMGACRCQGITKKGKEFFKFGANLTEDIKSMAVLNKVRPL